MNLHLAAFLLGIFGVPAVLLWLGHHLRKRSRRRARIFWGGVTGHLLAVVLSVSAGLAQAEHWSSQDLARGFFGLWSLLVFPLLGGLAGAIWPGSSASARPEPDRVRG